MADEVQIKFGADIGGAISLRQALGFDIEYADQRSDQERLHFDRVLASDAATLAENPRAMARSSN